MGTSYLAAYITKHVEVGLWLAGEGAIGIVKGGKVTWQGGKDEDKTYTGHCFDEPEGYHDEGTFASADTCTTWESVTGLGKGEVR